VITYGWIVCGEEGAMKVRTLIATLIAIAFVIVTALAADLVPKVRSLAQNQDVEAARELVEKNRPPQTQITAEWLAAASWVARGASFAKQWDLAQKYAQETFDRSIELLAKRSLEADGHLPIALGAAIEVLAQAYDAAGQRDAALDFLRRQSERFRDTSIETRIQKNILLLSLEGKPMPEVHVQQHLGPLPQAKEELKGKLVLFYFWAHWCGDCKRQKPILEALHDAYAEKGLLIIGPTQFYGYIARGEDATPEQELEYLTHAYQQRYPLPSWMSVPISDKNFLHFGVSTTPTLVLVDRAGIVRMYHPGGMSREELEARIQPLLGMESD
jgi:thiol-disulfide isomerase/thioredoxin